MKSKFTWRTQWLQLNPGGIIKDCKNWKYFKLKLCFYLLSFKFTLDGAPPGTGIFVLPYLSLRSVWSRHSWVASPSGSLSTLHNRNSK